MTASCSVCFCRHLALILLLSIYIVKSREYTYRMAIIPMTETIVIIGSGLAGLSAARRLQQAGHQALILDKGRRIGGRMSTRRAEGFLFNHGAQFVTARSERFKAVCQAAVDVGKLASWPLDGREQALSGTPAMRGLAEFMGQGLRIEQDVEVEHIICAADGWSISACQTRHKLPAGICLLPVRHRKQPGCWPRRRRAWRLQLQRSDMPRAGP